jgi:transposase
MEISIAHSSSVSSSNATLLVALELSKATWVVALSAPFSDRISHHSIAGGDAGALLKLIGQPRSRADAALGQPVRVVCCYEAGYDGFWLHRVLSANGIDNHVLDAASLLVNRRARRVKTDRIDVDGLIRALAALMRGEHHACRPVHVPSIEDEDRRRQTRERERLIAERTAHVNRIKGLLMAQGIRDFMPLRPNAAERLIELYRDSVRCRKNCLPAGGGRILLGAMIRGDFLTAEERQDLTELARDGLAEHRLARRANALVLLDRGMSCEEVGRVLLIDDDTIRTWHRLFEEDGVDGLAGFNYGGRACQLTLEQQGTLKAWVGETLPRTTREVGAWVEREFGIVYESRSGLIALLHRLGLEHRKPQAVSRKLDPAKQQAFIDAYETLLRTLPDDEAVLFADAAHPTHGARPVGCWAPKEVKVAVDQTSGRDRGGDG